MDQENPEDMHTLLNTLYVMTPQAYAHLDNATIRIEVERATRLRVPLHHIGALVCFGNVMISPALMHRLAEEGKSLVLLDNSGRFKARLEGPVSGNILLRQAQYRAAGDPVFTLTTARAMVAGKLRRGPVGRAARTPLRIGPGYPPGFRGRGRPRLLYRLEPHRQAPGTRGLCAGWTDQAPAA